MLVLGPILVDGGKGGWPVNGHYLEGRAGLGHSDWLLTLQETGDFVVEQIVGGELLASKLVTVKGDWGHGSGAHCGGMERGSAARSVQWRIGRLGGMGRLMMGLLRNLPLLDCWDCVVPIAALEKLNLARSGCRFGSGF